MLGGLPEVDCGGVATDNDAWFSWAVVRGPLPRRCSAPSGGCHALFDGGMAARGSHLHMLLLDFNPYSTFQESSH